MLLRKVLIFVPLLSLTACAAADVADGEEVGSDESDLSAAQIVGTLSYGQEGSFSNWPDGNRYSGVTFKGIAGDDVEILVRDPVPNTPFRRDPIAYLESPLGRIIARNNNANPTTKDALLKIKLPQTGTYTIAFKDARHDTISAQISLHATMNSCPHPRISKRGQVPAGITCSGLGFDQAAAAGNLSAVVTPSPTDCGHRIDIVDRLNVWKGAVDLSQDAPTNDTFVDATGQIYVQPSWTDVLPAPREFLSCKGRLNARFLDLDCNSDCKMRIPLR